MIFAHSGEAVESPNKHYAKQYARFGAAMSVFPNRWILPLTRLLFPNVWTQVPESLDSNSDHPAPWAAVASSSRSTAV